MVEDLKEIDRLGLKFIRKILSDGRDDNYYTKKVLNGSMMSEDEKGVINYLLENFEKKTVICEPGTGFGQIPLVLGALGFGASGIEVRADRFDGALTLKKMFSKRYPSSSKVKIIAGRYPENTPDADILLTFNFVSTFNKENKAGIIESFRGFKHAVVDARTFGVRRDTEEEREELMKEIESYGFDSKKAFGSFYIITRKDND